MFIRKREYVAEQNTRVQHAQILYQSTILNSLEETENALVNYSQEQERRDRAQSAVGRTWQSARCVILILFFFRCGFYAAVLLNSRIGTKSRFSRSTASK